jgi:pentatricopeptide repeat protein
MGVSMVHGHAASGLNTVMLLQAHGCKPSVVTYNTLLRACAVPRQWRFALQMWHAMRQAGIKPDIVSVRAWLSVMHGAGCWPAMLLVFLERLPRTVTKDPILQSKTCEALWSCGRASFSL